MKRGKLWIIVIAIVVAVLVLIIAVSVMAGKAGAGKTASLSVTSNPSSANLYVDGSYKGLTPFTVSGLSTGNHVVAVSKTGYGSYSKTQKLSPGSNYLSVTLTTSSGSTGDLYATTSPSSANLYVDGSYKGLTPLTVSGLSVGNHIVAVNKTLYDPYSETKYISEGNNSFFVYLIASTSSLSVTSSPSSANLYVDGSYKGLTPLTVSGLSMGYKVVTVNKTGYDTYSELYFVSEGSNSLNVTLTPVIVPNQTNQTGSLSVTSNPSSANLYIDGSYKGLTPLTVSSLSIGNHVVIVNKTGYDTYSETKYISEGSNSLNVTLTTSPVSTGNLYVTSDPSSADLYIDDSYRGLTPFTVLGLSIGYHDVKLIKSGYYTYIQTRNIFAGNNSFNAILTPIIVSNSTNSTNQTG